jgi:putative ATPase
LIASYSSGDCRNAYNTLEVAAQLALEPVAETPNRAVGPGFGPDIGTADSGGAFAPEVRFSGSLPEGQPSSAASKPAKHIDRALASVAVQQRVLMYDKSGEEHYNLISALHKSVRNSDPDAALYWLARMFASGEDPLYLARRVVRMAVEDIGLAAPEALNLCLSAKQAMEFLGSPEGDLALAEAVVYLCLAPKSNSVYTAYGAVQQEIERTRQEPVPLHLRNAPTRLMKELDYGKGYLYAHDEQGRVADMDCLPDSLRGHTYYQPTQEGREKLLAQRMEEIRRIRAAKHTGA